MNIYLSNILYLGGSSGSSGGGGASSGGGGGGYHYGGSGGLGGCGSGSSGNGNNDGNDGNGHRRNINNNNKGSILDMELDFEELPQAANSNTAKWFQEHQDINAGKILDGLLGLKTEFPDDNSNGSNPGSSNGSSMEKPPDMGSLDHTTANLLQMSVPDPANTFLDIGTDIGGASLYEDDPFNLDHLLPANFSINQLDLLPSSPDHHIQHNNNHHILNAHGAEASMTITPKTLIENNNTSHNLSLHQPGGAGHSSLPHPHHPQGSLPSAIGNYS